MRRAGSAIAVALVAGCRPGPPDDAVVSVPRWDIEQDLRIESPAEGPWSFSQIGALTVGPDGAIYVADWLAKSIFMFDSGGRYVTTIGRPGRGPGEFVHIGPIGWLGGRLFAVDGTLARVSLFSPDGEHIRTFRLSARTPSARRPRAPIGFLQNGDAVARPIPPPEVLATGEHVTPVLTIDTATGDIKDTLVQLPIRNLTLMVTAGDMRTFSAQPFGDDPLVKLAADGSHVVVVDRSTDLPEPRVSITLIGMGGDTLRHTSLPYVPIPIPPGVIDSVVEDLAAFPRQWSKTGVEQMVRKALFTPSHFPPVTRVLPGTDGTVWLRREELPGDSVRWDVLSADLEPLAEIRTVKAWRFLRANSSRVFAFIYDAFDVPIVVRLCVKRRDSACGG